MLEKRKREKWEKKKAKGKILFFKKTGEETQKKNPKIIKETGDETRKTENQENLRNPMKKRRKPTKNEKRRRIE